MSSPAWIAGDSATYGGAVERTVKLWLHVHFIVTPPVADQQG
jgi:hypothetical protein